MRRAKRAVLALVVFLLACEAAFRAVFVEPEVDNWNRILYSQLIEGDRTPRAFLANASFTWTSEPDGAGSLHQLNLYGFRDRPWSIEKDPARRRVLVVGDSFVEGFMVGPAETIPAVLERDLVARGKAVEVLNLGVGATGLPHYLTSIRDAVTVLAPDEVVLVLYANDFPAPAYEREWLANGLRPHRPRPLPRALAVARRVWKGLPVARRWHARPFPFVPPVPDPRNPFTADAASRSYVAPRLADAMRRGAFNPFVADLLGHYARVLKEPIEPRPHLEGLLAYLRASGVTLRVAYVPAPVQVADRYVPFMAEYSQPGAPASLLGDDYSLHERTLASTCRELGVPFAGTTTKLRELERAGTRLYFDHDEHMRPEGYAAVAAELARWWP